MRVWHWRNGMVGLLALFAFFAVASSAEAASFTVNSTADGTQFSPGVDPNCETASGNHQCTLRAAVMETNAIGGTNTITLPANASAYKLTISGQDNTAQAGDLDVIDDQSLTIVGGGASSTIIDGNHIDRVFDVASASSLTLSGVTIENGKAPAPASGENGDGGAIRSKGTLFVSDSTLVNNTTTPNGGGNAGSGGGVAADGSTPTTLTNVDFTTNSATSGGDCGAVAEEGAGQVTVTGGTMDGNKARFCGAVGEEGGGHVAVTGTTIRNSNALLSSTSFGEGGAAVEDGAGTLTLTNAVLTGNSAQFGAGVSEDGGGEVDVTNTTIAGNHAVHTSAVQFPSENGSGAGIGEDGGGVVKVLASTISGNTADTHGGGIMANGGSNFPVVDSTIAGNTATNGGGGGVRVDGGDTVTLLNDTVNGNSSQGGGDLGICDVSHTGDNFCDGHIAAQNSIVSAGSPVNCATSGTTDISIDSHGHNIDSGTSCGFTQAGDLQNANPLLGPLQANGGPTATEALGAGSPAINAADNTACGNGAGMSGPNDQRGLPRISGPACDIGAFELQPGEGASPGSGPTTALGPPVAIKAAKPRIRVSGVPRGCVRGSFTMTVAITSSVPLKKVRIARDGHGLHSKKKKRQRITINAGSLGQGRHHIRISARSAAGTANKTVSFRRCARPVVLPRFTG